MSFSCSSDHSSSLPSYHPAGARPVASGRLQELDSAPRLCLDCFIQRTSSTATCGLLIFSPSCEIEGLAFLMAPHSLMLVLNSRRGHLVFGRHWVLVLASTFYSGGSCQLVFGLGRPSEPRKLSGIFFKTRRFWLRRCPLSHRHCGQQSTIGCRILCSIPHTRGMFWLALIELEAERPEGC